MEVRAREAEHDAHVSLGEHDRVDENAAISVLERDHQRNQKLASDDPADDVSPGHLVEHRPDDLDPFDDAPLPEAVEVSGDLSGHVRDALVEVFPGRTEAHVAEQILEQQGQRPVIEVGVGTDCGGDVRQRIEIRGDELDLRRHPYCAKHSWRMRIQRARSRVCAPRRICTCATVWLTRRS